MRWELMLMNVNLVEIYLNEFSCDENVKNLMEINENVMETNENG